MTQQDDITQRVLTDDEIRGEIHNAIGFGFESGELQSVNAADLMNVAYALLSKLRAPVSNIREGFELTYAADADDPACASDLSHFTNGWQACIASQVHAPLADERAAFETAMQNRGQNIDRWPNPHGGYRRLSTEIAWYAWNDRAALASAPVPKPWPVEEQPDGTVTPVDPVDMASAPVAGEARPDDLNKRLLEATIRDLAAISEHLGLDPNEGGADPIIEAIDELRRERDDWVDAQYAAAGDAAPQASAPVAGEAQGWSGWACQYPNKLPRLYGSIEIARLNCDAANGDRVLFLSERAAPQGSAEYERGHADGWAAGWDQAIKQPQADKDGAEQALKDLVTHGVSVQRIAPADFMADRQPRAGDGKTREAVDYPRGGALNFDDPAPASAEGIRSPYNACMHRNECRAMLDRQERAGEVPSDDALAQIGYAAAIAEVGWGEAWADLESDGDTQQEWRAGAKAIRAALSVPQAEQGERDA